MPTGKGKSAAAKQKIKELLALKHQHYNQVFNVDSQAVKAVLEDLSIFCRENESCFHADPRLHAVLEGRREVLLKIKECLRLQPEEYVDKHINKGL